MVDEENGLKNIEKTADSSLDFMRQNESNNKKANFSGNLPCVNVCVC